MPSRQGHIKSRHGCSRCKQRRVKCNERAPCQHCSRRKEECSLLRRSAVNSITPLRSSSSLESDPMFFLSHLSHGPRHQQTSCAATWGEDLYLMSHFTYSTAGTLSQRAEMARLWQSIVPEEAIACPFLIHGMLAVSALHVAGRRPSHRFRYERCCRQHQNQAIPEYRQAIQTISTDSVGRIFAMSYLVSILSLAAVSDNALRDEERHTEMQTSIDDIMAVVTVIRGIHAIVRPAHLRRRLMNSPYVILLTGHSPLSSSQRASLPAHVPSRYQMLRDECLKDLIAPNDHEVYKLCTEAIDLLEKVHRDVFSVKPLEDAEFSYLVKWIALVPSGFVTLIRERHAAALVILGDFAVIFKWLENIWFLKNWAANALRAIREATSPAGREWLNAVSCF